MPRYALRLEYDGTGYAGWQRQDGVAGVRTVQAAVEAAAAPLNGGVPPASVVAGRTDAGVHAEGQVAHLDLAADLPPERVREAVGWGLREARASPLACARVGEDWSARFSAAGRAYRYVILNRAPRPALDAGRVWHVRGALDAAAMRDAARGLLGRHDFSAYRAASCQARDALRTLDRLDVSREGERVVVVAEARSFLHHQVRNLVGTLVEVGLGRRPASWPRAVLDGRDRRRAGQTAPPEGLCLTRVRYDPEPGWV